MKALHRIRRNLILLLFMLHIADSKSPPEFDFNQCRDADKSLICAVHSSCMGLKTIDKYITRAEEELKGKKCNRYLIIRAKGLDKVEIEFRDDSLEPSVGAVFRSVAHEETFKCVRNNATSNGLLHISAESAASASDKVYCKFLATAKSDPKSILTVLTDNSLGEINYGGKIIEIETLPIKRMSFPCAWEKHLFKNANYVDTVRDDEEKADLITGEVERTCEYFNWYSMKSSSDPKDWKRIDKFTCAEGKITTTNTDGIKEPLDFDRGFTKCTRPICSACSKPLMNGSGANFTPTDGTSCAKITCPKAMLIDNGDVSFPHSNKTLECIMRTTDTEKKPMWGTYENVKNVTCVDDVSCMLLDPINSTCPAVIPEGKNCTEAQLNSTINPAVCAQDQEIWFKPQADKVARQVTTFTCSTMSGKWEVANVTSATNGNVYCLKVVEKIEEEVVAPQKGSAGQLIGIICGVAFVVIIIIIVFVFCARRHFNKKGKWDEMKSVSVTGRGDKKSKKKKDKKSKSSSSATSEISVPPPPPCPDSLPGLKVEPDLPPPSAVPPSFTAVCPPSSGGASGKGGEAAAVPIVGPDTGKPDKPAELIDIKLLESEKKTEKESSRKSDKDKDQEATLVNTVTGTQSGAEPVKNDATDTKKTDKNDATDTKKTEKHGESSDTGRNTKAGTKTKKDIKKQVDRHGRGLTDDDDYNIDEGAKPVNRVDKNKKPYAPVVDPRKKKINVTMTEDEEGHLKPRGKDSPF